MSNDVYYGTKFEEIFSINFGSNIDERGEFRKIYSKNAFNYFKNEEFKIQQVNYSKNKEIGTIRGLHFQNPQSEKKIIKCINGEIFDVIVDIRPSSTNYLKWMGIILSKNSFSIFIPNGFAHGFQTLKESTEILYLHSEEYNPNLESGIRYNDPKINVNWPLKCSKISIRDQNFKLIS